LIGPEHRFGQDPDLPKAATQQTIQQKAGLAPAFYFEFLRFLLTPAADQQQAVDE
jgi:hypothetical protein